MTKLIIFDDLLKFSLAIANVVPDTVLSIFIYQFFLNANLSIFSLIKTLYHMATLGSSDHMQGQYYVIRTAANFTDQKYCV